MIKCGDVGKRKWKVDIETSTETPDDHGQRIKSWVNHVASVPAEVLSVSGGEVIRGIQVDANANHLVKCQFIASVTTEMRVKWTPDGATDQYLNIVAKTDKTGERMEMVLHCKESV